jgi:SAM-dependent methyltransferase
MKYPNRAHVPRSSRSWDAVADWYAGWTGTTGSRHHQTLAIPLAHELLELRRGEALVDLGCGPGVIAPSVAKVGASLTGIDLSPRLIATARRNHGARGSFHIADVTRLKAEASLRPASFDAALFLLSIQDIDPLEAAVASAAWLLKPGGRLVLVMLHPCFRVPRQSGWGWDEKRSLQYRRLDSYLSPLAVPMQPYPGKNGTTRSYHRPLGVYMAALAEAGLSVTAMREVAGLDGRGGTRAERRATAEFPLLLGLKATR